MHFILIVAYDLLFRSLLGAQLKEEGFEVLGVATLDEAVLQLGEVGTIPSLLIMESKELGIDQKALDLLGRICAEVPLLLIHGAWDKPSQLKWAAGIYELVKPLSLGQIVEKAKELLAT